MMRGALSWFELVASACQLDFADSVRSYGLSMLDAKPTALGFALTGRMGSVCTGLTEADAVDMWGSPTTYRLTTPPSRWWGPVAIFLGSGRRITHMGIYFEGLGGEAREALGASPISLDLVPETTPTEFRRRVSEAGAECEDATDLTFDDDAVLLIRVLGSGVVGVWDEQGLMTCLSSEEEGGNNAHTTCVGGDQREVGSGTQQSIRSRHVTFRDTEVAVDPVPRAGRPKPGAPCLIRARRSTKTPEPR